MNQQAQPNSRSVLRGLLYPGAPILLVTLRRGRAEGDVRVQEYDEANFRVAMFVPGVVIDLPGEDSRVEPEMSQWVKDFDEAQELFQRYVEIADKIGWTISEKA